jgi:hypothetical protein
MGLDYALFSGLLLVSVAFAGATGRTGIDPDALPIWRPGVDTLADAAAVDSVSTESSLSTSGSKSIQVTVGEGGADIGQELRLSVQGEARPGLFIDARLTDVGRESGDQVTATLQEVDEMYFRMEGSRGFVQLGDQDWTLDRMGLLGLQRSTLGASAGIRGASADVRGLYGTDETERITNVISGNAGQQKGYVISPGQSRFLVVVPGSEKVFLNGQLLTDGVDYSLNSAGGVLDFLGALVPGPTDEIRVEFDTYNRGNLQELRLAEGAYHSRHLWIDLAGFRLGTDTQRMRQSSWTDSEWQRLQADSGDSAGVVGDSGEVLERPRQVELYGARLRGQWMEQWFFDTEMALHKEDSNSVSAYVGGPQGRAFRWEFSSDSSRVQRSALLKVDVRGDARAAGFSAPEFQGGSRTWDSYELRDRWDLDSAGLDGGLRWDELEMRLKLPGGWFPGFYQGYRRALDDSAGWNSLRSRGFLQHRQRGAESELALEHVASEQTGSVERWQGSGNVVYNEGEWRPFADFRAALWDRLAQRDTLLRAGSGLEWGRSASGRFARGELRGERSDSVRSAQWTQYGDWRGKGWLAHHLFQVRRESNDSTGESSTWLLEQSGNFGGTDGAWRGNGAYEFGYTREVPWEAIYEAVPAGTGDVLYDSLTGEYVEGVDNGNYTYVGQGRTDSAEAVRTLRTYLRLDLNVELGPALRIRRGFLADIELGMRGEWEGRDTSTGVQVLPPFIRSQLRSRDEGMASIEGIVLWTHPRGFGNIEFHVGEEDEKSGSTVEVWQERRWQSVENRYTGRERETWTLKLLREDVERMALLELYWEIGEAGLSWRRELPLGLALEPSGRWRVAQGDDGFESLDARLVQGGLTAYWRDPRGNEAHCGGTWTLMRTEASALPYALMEGFGEGQTWRGEAQAVFAAHEHFNFSLGYVIRWGDAEDGLFQKLSTEAKAIF